jgi:hypothetical protein
VNAFWGRGTAPFGVLHALATLLSDPAGGTYWHLTGHAQCGEAGALHRAIKFRTAAEMVKWSTETAAAVFH